MGEIPLANPTSGGLFRSTTGIILMALLGALLLAAIACPRDPQELSGPERTVLAAARSVAHDFDLRFDDRDRARLEGLSHLEKTLQLKPSPSGDDRSFIGVTGVYPILLAPWVRWAPLRGPMILNALLLAILAVVASQRLGQRLGQAAMALVALCVFASVFYRSAFLVQPVVLLATCVALAFSLVFRHEEPAHHGMADVYRPIEGSSESAARGGMIGLLLGVVVLHHPMFLLMVLPAVIAAPPDRRRARLTGLVTGLLLVLVLSGLTVGLWGRSIQHLSDSLGSEVPRVSVGVSTWNLLYFGVGRNVGLLPYFLPALALLGLWKGGSGRSVLVVTAIVGALGSLVIQPYDFFGGPAAVGNGWLIPWFVLLWFVAAQPLPRGWLMATLLLAAPAMYPTWLAPSVEPLTDQGTYRHASGRFHRYLPVETTQEPLPPGEVMGNRFWIRSLSGEARVSGSGRWLLRGEDWAELHLSSPSELASLHFQFGPQAEAALEIRGADLGDMVLLPDGGIGFRVENLKRRGIHPMWFSADRHFNYVLQFHMPMEEPRAQTLSIIAIAADLERQEP